MQAKVRAFNQIPPGGEWFAVINGEKESDKHWLRLRPRVVELMAKHGVTGTAEEVVAASMCPYMPAWFCEGVNDGRKVVQMKEAKETAKEYFPLPVVPFDEISRRLQICSGCKKHDHTLCLTCTGLLRWLIASFGNRRTAVPEDKLSGTCECSRTFAAVAASVDYPETGFDWEGVPDNCWRKTK